VVATLLRLRFRVLGNQLTASVWQLIGFVVGMLWAAAVLFMVWAGLIAAGFAGLELVSNVVTGGGAVLLLGWIVGPVLLTGVDTTLDPDKLAPFPISTGRMMLALTAAGLTGVPGIATTLGALAIVPAFLHWPLAAVAAVPAVVLGVLTCVLASRLATSLMSGAGGNRRVREVIGGIAFLLLLLIGPIIAGISGMFRGAGPDPLTPVLAAVDAVSWTPLAAAWAIPGEVAAGAWLAVLVKSAVAIATPALLWWLWRRILVASQGAPVQRASRKVKQGKLGWFGRMPSGPVGGSWARSQTYWLHDPRYLRQLISVPVFPILILFSSGGDVQSTIFAFSAVLIAFVFGVVPYTDVSYDGTAFASVLATGVRGRADRAGRMLAAAAVGLPLLVLAAVITVGLSGQWWILPGVLGASVGLMLTGFGVCAVSSALIVIPVAAPGDSPFKRVPGTTFVMGLMMFLVWAVILVLGAPAIVLAVIAAVTGAAMFSWIALAVGLVLGVAFLIVGILVGGRVFDRTAPDLLLRLRTMQRA